MAIGACIERFMTYMRHVIVIDGTFLKEQIGEVLLVAITKDGNNQITNHISK